MTPPTAQAGALCAQTDPELWFPEHGFSPRRAKQICGRCPLEDACLAYALSAPMVLVGVWGGTTEFERRALRRRSA